MRKIIMKENNENYAHTCKHICSCDDKSNKYLPSRHIQHIRNTHELWWKYLLLLTKLMYSLFVIIFGKKLGNFNINGAIISCLTYIWFFVHKDVTPMKRPAHGTPIAVFTAMRSGWHVVLSTSSSVESLPIDSNIFIQVNSIWCVVNVTILLKQ